MRCMRYYRSVRLIEIQYLIIKLNIEYIEWKYGNSLLYINKIRIHRKHCMYMNHHVEYMVVFWIHIF